MSSRGERGNPRPVPAQVEAVHRRIEHWRSTREKRTRMPKELWEAAASVAREHGLWSVARALRVNYESLKRRVGPRTRPERSSAAKFVELDATQVVEAYDRASATIELSSRNGARLTVRLEGHDAVLDVTALADGFWKHNR